jgi:hypothetical protein
MDFHWTDILLIIFNSYYTYKTYKKDIDPKTAKEYDYWSNYMYTNTRCHFEDRRTYSLLMIIFMWTIGFYFYRWIIHDLFL